MREIGGGREGEGERLGGCMEEERERGRERGKGERDR